MADISSNSKDNSKDKDNSLYRANYKDKFIRLIGMKRLNKVMGNCLFMLVV
jgi:hypothetical protein